MFPRMNESLTGSQVVICKRMIMPLWFVFMMSAGVAPALAAVMPLAVVSGSFIYTRAESDGDTAKIAYQVEATNYHGIDAWRITWSDARMDAVHYIRRNEGAPLYTRRIDHVRQQTVEISYSPDPEKPHIYRRERRDETLVRRIRHSGLIDMGSLPQVLAGVQAAQGPGELHFSAIDYSDGQVYALLASRIGYSTQIKDGEGVRYAIYETNLDSWKAAFNPAVRLLVPASGGQTNFATYSGPDPAGSGEPTTLHMQSHNADVATLSMIQGSSLTP